MQYYRLNEACANKETGPECPQIQKWKPGYDEDKSNSYYSYYEASSRGRIFPDFEPDLDALLLQNKAKPTDLISSIISTGFIISNKLKSIFEQFNFPPHRFYEAKVIHKEKELDNY